FDGARVLGREALRDARDVGERTPEALRAARPDVAVRQAVLSQHLAAGERRAAPDHGRDHAGLIVAELGEGVGAPFADARQAPGIVRLPLDAPRRRAAAAVERLQLLVDERPGRAAHVLLACRGGVAGLDRRPGR